MSGVVSAQLKRDISFNGLEIPDKVKELFPDNSLLRLSKSEAMRKIREFDERRLQNIVPSQSFLDFNDSVSVI